jgi:putative FmdB family regulatory protein
MPIYEYKCSECNTKFEILHKSTSIQDVIRCPACDSTENKKLFSSFSSQINNDVNLSAGSCVKGSCRLSDNGCSSGLCGMN